MTFIPENFKLSRGNEFSNAPSGGAAIHTYINLSDTIATITAAGYFPAYFGQDIAGIGDNDYVYLTGSDNTILVRFANISSSPTIQTTFNNVTRTTGSFNVLLNGPWGGSPTIAITYRTINKMVILSIPTTYAPALQSAIITSSPIPSNLKPWSTYQTSIPIFMPTFQEGYIAVDASTGVITMAQYGPHVTAGSSYGYPDLSIFYFTN